MVVFFDDLGQVTSRIKMGAPGSGHTFFYRLSSNLWHTVLPLSEFVIIHETAAGPFVKEEANIAAWAPQESDAKGIKKFLARILRQSQA